MKKLLVLLLIGGAFVAFTSCKKTCTCDTWLLGEKTITVSDIDLGGHAKCSDLNTVIEIDGKKNGVECK
ncbi:MAG: hypothetical protein FWC34_09635 [Bacteroidetes bacterium]|nr:hypothetical protein [Bacteroidota bacterium]MCL2302031.1 hypothetical protein [Lentimicrobiaceae bacterium]